MPTPAWYVSLREWGLETLRPGMMLRLSAVGLAVELLIAASTLAPGAPVLPQWPQFVLVPLIFVIHFSAILRVQASGRRRLRWREMVAEVPPVFVAAAVILLAGAWLVSMASLLRLGGQPTMSGGHYYLNDHGTLLPVRRAAYEHARVLEERIFTLGPSIFFTLGVLVHYPRRGVAAGAFP